MTKAKPLLTPAAKLQQPKKFRHHRTHATLGLYVILHFAYRYVIFFLSIDTADHYRTAAADMGFTNHLLHHKRPNLFVASLFLPHVLLQISGFGFHVPKTRHPDGNQIWAQYRTEALIFFGRCVALLSLAWHRKTRSRLRHNDDDGGGGTWHAAVALCIVLLTMLAADTVAERYRAVGRASRTIRGLNAPVAVQYLMSATQFHATLHSLMTADTLSVQMAALTVVQTSAFGMTLRRKGVITQPVGVLLYALVLVMGMAVIVCDLKSRGVLYFAIALGNIAALVRFELAVNKFWMWCAVAVFLRWVSAAAGGGDNGGELSKLDGRGFGTDHWIWLIASIGSSVLLLLGAAKRQFLGEKRTK